MDASAQDPAAAPRGAWLLGLAAVVLVTGAAWLGALGVPFTGEDDVILQRIRAGVLGSPHVFRPVSDGCTALVHALVGSASPAPYHAASILVHAACAALVVVVARALFADLGLAVAAGLLFGLGAGAADAVVWIPAVSRPFACVGALVVLHGLARWEAAPRAATAEVLLGVLFGLVVNEEAYASAGTACVWLAGCAALGRARGRSLAVAGVVAAAAAAHYAFLLRTPIESGTLLDTAPRQVLANVVERMRLLGGGWSLPGPVALAAPLLGALAIAASGRTRAAALLALAWCASFLPFSLASDQTYYAYPTQAPAALLVAAGVVCLPRVPRAVSVTAVALLAAVGSLGPRGARLAAWGEATREVQACRELLAEGVVAADGHVVLVNLEFSSIGPFVLALDDPDNERIRRTAFLDAASGHALPERLPEVSGDAVWLGRRCEGSVGIIDPPTYFAARPEVAPLRLYDAFELVGSFEEARARLADAGFDVTTTCLVEADAPADLAGRDLTGSGELGPLVVANADFVEVTGSMRVAVEGATILALQEPWLFSHFFRLSPDQRLFPNVDDRRTLVLEARDADGARLPTFRCNGLGFGVLLAPGEHELTLRWTPRTTAAMRAR